MSSPDTTKPIRPGRLWQTRSRSYISEIPSLLHTAQDEAMRSVARDVEEEPVDDPDRAIDDSSPDSGSDSEVSSLIPVPTKETAGHSMVGSFRRPSFTMAGSRGTVVPGLQGADRNPTKKERHEARREERSLLRDNNVIPPKHPRRASATSNVGSKVVRHMPSIPGGNRKIVRPDDEEANQATADRSEDLSETAPLLGNPDLPYGGYDSPKHLNQKWEEAVMTGKIQTTWQRESKVIGRYSAPLILTFVLQYSLTVAGIFTVGHLGIVELGAVSLASMTGNITGFAIHQGLATSLDTLCAQAYGSGRKKLVGLQTQRMVYFLWAISIPIGVIWLCAEPILNLIVPEPEVAVLAGLYLKILVLGLPAYGAYESGKRYLQAQGLFSAALYVLLIASPLNAFMNWLFVWRFGWGFVGAPIAVVVTDNILPVLLVLYVRFVAGRGCWPGFTRRAFHNWGPMVRLALPGLVMVEAEVLAFEILTLASSSFGTTYLAAQTVLSTLCSITWQIPFPVSIAASTRIANFIGATLPGAARTTAKVGMVAAFGIGLFNVLLMASMRNYIPKLFTSDAMVIEVVASVLPVCATFQLFDALAANTNGILRGLGRQEVGGWIQLFCYYVVAMPISFGTAFGLHWGLYGLWLGVAVALALVASIEAVFLYRTDWNRSVEDAKKRNTFT